MEEFNYAIKIRGDEFSCTGNQLVEILQLVDNFLNGWWYCDDVEANKKNDNDPYIEIKKVQKIDSIRDFIDLSSEVSQFISGVFILLDMNLEPSKLNSMFTEENQFINFNNELLQIRAFDTTYYEIYSNDKDLVVGLLEEFGILASSIQKK